MLRLRFCFKLVVAECRAYNSLAAQNSQEQREFEGAVIVDVCVQQQSFQVVCLIETLKQNLLSRCLLLFMASLQLLRVAEVVLLLILLLQIQLLLKLLPEVLEEMEEAEEVSLVWLLP